MPQFVSRTRFDLAMAGVLAAYLAAFCGLYLAGGGTPETAVIRGFGSLAFLMLSFTLCIGPLARFSPRFQNLIYNRRHLGVTTFFVGLVHAALSLAQFFEGDLLGVFTTNTAYGDPARFPFAPFGVLALVILAAMAATSHDSWFRRLGVRHWKSLHMLVYAAYASLVVHVSFGFLQQEGSVLLWSAFVAVVATVFGLQIVAGLRERVRDGQASPREVDGYVYACELASIPEGGARSIPLGAERVAVVKHQGRAYALTNVCKHQNGPLGEGRVCDGFLECPWHGYQFSPVTGKGPPPYEDAVHVYAVRTEGGRVFVNPQPFYWNDRNPSANAGAPA
ncbi:MAG TPA: ferric reductase-like transmembrane domain-containing protein [Planctomycetota bacterium]